MVKQIKFILYARQTSTVNFLKKGHPGKSYINDRSMARLKVFTSRKPTWRVFEHGKYFPDSFLWQLKPKQLCFPSKMQGVWVIYYMRNVKHLLRSSILQNYRYVLRSLLWTEMRHVSITSKTGMLVPFCHIVSKFFDFWHLTSSFSNS